MVLMTGRGEQQTGKTEERGRDKRRSFGMGNTGREINWEGETRKKRGWREMTGRGR